MSDQRARVYDVSTYRKHKRPEGWGSLCPQHLTVRHAQTLLDEGVRLGHAVYNVDGDLAFKAFEHRPGLWHGFPIPWTRLPPDAVAGLIEQGTLDRTTWRKAIRKNWGREFEE